jgi:hypothetical protein
MSAVVPEESSVRSGSKVELSEEADADFRDRCREGQVEARRGRDRRRVVVDGKREERSGDRADSVSDAK